MVIWNIHTTAINHIFGHLVAIWNIFPVLVYCVKKKSGSPAPDLSLLVHDELDGSGADVVDSPGSAHSGFAKTTADFRTETFDHS
jgi:hypothetical protein